jgi:hypothetical protein
MAGIGIGRVRLAIPKLLRKYCGPWLLRPGHGYWVGMMDILRRITRYLSRLDRPYRRSAVHILR